MWTKGGEVMLFVLGLLTGACLGVLTFALVVAKYSANMPYPHKVLIKFKDGHEIWFKC